MPEVECGRGESIISDENTASQRFFQLHLLMEAVKIRYRVFYECMTTGEIEGILLTKILGEPRSIYFLRNVERLLLGFKAVYQGRLIQLMLCWEPEYHKDRKTE